MMALILIGLAAEVQSISGQLRREREVEMIHRGAQYARAIKRYYAKFHNYPNSFEQLQDTNHLRFLRKRYKDPVSGKDFRALHYGDVQFGGTTGNAACPTCAATGATAGASAFGQASPSPSPTPASSSTPGTDTGSQNSATAQAGQASGSAQTSVSQMGGTGPTFGGGPIIGVASVSEKQGFHSFNKKDHYNDWYFVYDPTTDRSGVLIKGPYDPTLVFGNAQIPGAVTPGQPAAGQPAGTGSTGAPNPGANANPPAGNAPAGTAPTP
jgi:type II secretory pathway pseudopilin PulG